MSVLTRVSGVVAAAANALVQTLPSRTGRYGEAYTQSVGASNWGFADEGSYVVVNNATLGTPIDGHAAPVIADGSTKPLFFLFNGGSKNVIMDYLYLEVTAAGTGGTIHYTTVYLDNKGSTARTATGTEITAFASSNSGNSAESTGLSCYFGAVAATMSSPVKIGQQIVREVIPVVQDTILMKFGSPDSGPHSALTTAGTATNHCVQYFAPVVVAPGGNLNISQIRASQTVAASYQFSAGFVIR